MSNMAKKLGTEVQVGNFDPALLMYGIGRVTIE